MRRYVPTGPETHVFHGDGERDPASLSATNNDSAVVPPTHQVLLALKRKREAEQEPSGLAAVSTLASVAPSMLAVVEKIQPPTVRYDAGERIPTRRGHFPAATQNGGYHRAPVGASNAMLSELLIHQDLMQSSRRTFALANGSILPSISDSLYPQSSPAAASLLSSPLYAGLRGASSLLAPPNTLYSGGRGDLLVSIPQYDPSNINPRLPQLSVPASDAYNPLLLYQLPSCKIGSALRSSSFGGALDPYNGILRDHSHGIQQRRLEPLARVPIHLPRTTAGLQNEFGNPNLAQLNLQPGSNMNCHPLLAAAQPGPVLLAVSYLPPPSTESPQADYASDTLISLGRRANSSYTGSSCTTGTGGGQESFPMVLHRAMTELELDGGQTDIATFLLDGKSFLIRNQFIFEKRVLPVFFPKMKSFASFQRQLNLYDFKRVGGVGVDRGAYHHALFARGSPDDASKMKRTKLKGGPPRGPARRKKDHIHRDNDEDTGDEGGRQIQEPPAEGRSEK